MSSPEMVSIRRLWRLGNAGRIALSRAYFDMIQLGHELECPTEQQHYNSFIGDFIHAHKSRLDQIPQDEKQRCLDESFKKSGRRRRAKERRRRIEAETRLIPTSLRSMTAPASQRRRRCAIARAWCLQSGVSALRDLTDLQSQIVIEVLRACLKNPHRSAYLTFDQIADKAGCARTTAITTVKILAERGLLFVKRRIIRHGHNAPNLYFPCRHLVRQLGALVDPERDDGHARAHHAVPGIGVQNSASPCSNIYNNHSYTESYAKRTKRRSQSVAPSAGATKRTPPAIESTEPPATQAASTPCSGTTEPRRPQISRQPAPTVPAETAADRTLLAQAVALIDGKPIASSPDMFELLARSEAIRQAFLPKLLPDVFAHHARRHGIGAPAALLATVLKRLTHSQEPIRDPLRYYLGTIRRTRAGGRPLQSLSQILATHTAQDCQIDIAARFEESRADSARGQGHPFLPPPVTVTRRDEGVVR